MHRRHQPGDTIVPAYVNGHPLEMHRDTADLFGVVDWTGIRTYMGRTALEDWKRVEGQVASCERVFKSYLIADTGETDVARYECQLLLFVGNAAFMLKVLIIDWREGGL